ncbi:MAG: toll/interleukin-1 receptor domain-containing protein [Myxococcales bacterium]|nr:MAG: toll/interleukin-1 receptor domain-containing protein [Myxococcales bacterium]
MEASIFVSYSHKDARLMSELRAQLSAVDSGPSIDAWDDSKISVGRDFRAEIMAAIERARVAVLLLSPSFWSSAFINQVELPELLMKLRSRGLVICLVHVRRTLKHRHSQLGNLNALNEPTRPLAELRKPQREQAWASIAEKILSEAEVGNRRSNQARIAASAYEAFAAKLRFFCLKALDLKSAFEFLAATARYSVSDLDELNAAISRYNPGIEELIVRGKDLALAVGRELPRDLGEEVDELLAFALDDIHRRHAFQLNEAWLTMSRLQRGEVPPDRIAEVSSAMDDHLQPHVRGVSEKVPVLQRRIDRVAERVAQL